MGGGTLWKVRKTGINTTVIRQASKARALILADFAGRWG